MKTISLMIALLVLGICGSPAHADDVAPALAADETTVLVTGANRGLGLEFVRQLSAKGYTVIGTARRPEAADELKAAADRVEQLDVADPASVAALAERLEGVAIDILINNAGILDRRDLTIDTVDYAAMDKAYQVNAVGPLRVTQALLPNVRAGQRKMILSVSSQLGSIERSRGRYYSYRASKAALNMINSIWSAEFGPEGFICTVLHPGWVRTDLGGPNATFSPEESIAGLIKVIEGLTVEDNGKFYDLHGELIPW